MEKNGHRAGHRMVEIKDPADKALFAEQVRNFFFLLRGNVLAHLTRHSQANRFEESICVGLRVYTNKECTAVIEGQMRYVDCNVTEIPLLRF